MRCFFRCVSFLPIPWGTTNKTLSRHGKFDSVCFHTKLQLNISLQTIWCVSAAQKIKKLSETPVIVHNIAKLCVIDGKNREITKKLVQPVPPHPCWTHGNFNGKMTKKIKWPKITFPGSKMIPKVSKWGF